MSATEDAFARFLEALADSLDDHEASGEALAQARPAFLSQVGTIIEDGRLDETSVDAI